MRERLRIEMGAEFLAYCQQPCGKVTCKRTTFAQTSVLSHATYWCSQLATEELSLCVHVAVCPAASSMLFLKHNND